MPDVSIGQCVMRVVRRGGWSWGPEPGGLVTAAVRALPGLLAAELERLLPEDAGGDVTAPLRLDVRVSLAELRAWTQRAALVGGTIGPATSATTPAAAGASPAAGAVVRALQHALAEARVAERVTAAARPGTAIQPELPAAAQVRASSVFDLLSAWGAAGRLNAELAALPDAVIATWHRVLLDSPVTDVPVGRVPSGVTAEAVVAPLAARASSASPADRMRLRLAAAVALARDAGLPPGSRAAREAMAALDAHEPAPRPVRPAARPAPAGRTTPAAVDSEVSVSSALPFLLLGPLHRIGWLDLVDATLAGAGLERALPSFATALATKVLPEPERGWRRTPQAVAAATAFAGRREPVPDEAVADLARVAGSLAPGLDGTIRRSLMDGRRPGDPVVLCASGGTRLLVEPLGVFLLAYAADATAAAERSKEAGAPVFVAEADADPALLAALDAAGVTFVTPAPPVRGEPWRPLSGTRAPRLFTNGHPPAFSPSSDEVVDRARETWDAFLRRTLPGRPANSSLDFALAFAAAAALGTIAWMLFRETEPTDPPLALARFGDLGGRVRFEPDRVRVQLPLGRRFRDLERAGLLDDVPRVPWLDRRPVVFSGG